MGFAKKPKLLLNKRKKIWKRYYLTFYPTKSNKKGRQKEPHTGIKLWKESKET